MTRMRPTRRVAVATTAVLAGSLLVAAYSATSTSSAAPLAGIAGQTSGLLPASKVILESTVQVNLDHHSATLPLHRGAFGGRTVWYVLTEASEEGAARDLNLNFAPKLANAAIGCPTCVQLVTQTVPRDSKFGEAITTFIGVPDFSPTRVLTPGSSKPFPPAVAQPGAVGDAKYSPLIRFSGSTTVYNAPIVATGDGPFDVVRHTNTADRVLAVNPAKQAGPDRYYAPSVELLIINGFDSGQPILYLSTEASEAVTATLERATFVPLLGMTPFMGGDDFLGSVRERIFPFINGQTGLHPQAQGLTHLIVDGHASEDASLRNTALLAALRNGGDALNVQGDFPTLADPHRKFAYSPLWEAQFGQWTDKAIRLGLNKRQTDEFKILNLAATRPDLITGPMGMPYGSTNVLINCPVIAFTAKQPAEDLVRPIPGAQVETSGSFTP
ncbi:MAG: hypothetical protein ABJC62_02715 [Frankiaceae bacterium]